MSRRFKRNARFRRVDCEALESRRLFDAALNTNLLINGDAETGAGAANATTANPPPGWSYTLIHVPDTGFTAVQYGASGGLPNSSTPGPANRGNNFFAGGPDLGSDTIYQDIDISNFANAIDAGQIKATLSGWLGGWFTEGDHLDVSMFFSKGPNTVSTDQLALPSVLAADRGNVTSFIQRTVSGTVPRGTRLLSVFLDSERENGTYNDGYADDLAVTLTSTTKKGFIQGLIGNDRDGGGRFGDGDQGIKGVTVYVDKNNNGKLDPTEIRVKTISGGSYLLSNVPAGEAFVRVVLPAGFRSSSDDIADTFVSAGLTSTAEDLLITQTCVISGRAFTDTNRNGTYDLGEAGLDGITVYLDFNNNGQLDWFELKTTTQFEGSYKFTEPFGTYVVRQQLSRAYRQTSPGKGQGLTEKLGKGQVDKFANFGDINNPAAVPGVVKSQSQPAATPAAATVETNLLVNGDAEANSGASNSSSVVSPSGWTTTLGAGFTVVKYGAGSPLPDTTFGSLSNANFFAGGPFGDSKATQDVDVSSQAAAIDAGNLVATLLGRLGGIGIDNDFMDLSYAFLDQNRKPIAGIFQQPADVHAVDRSLVTAFRVESATNIIPAKTRFIRVTLHAVAQSGGYNNALADDVLLALRSSFGLISGTVFNDTDGDGTTAPADPTVAGVKVFVDTNNDGKLEKGEPSAITDAMGVYTIKKVRQGAVIVRDILPAGFRDTQASSRTVGVRAGAETPDQDFAISQTVQLSGRVFLDKNTNGRIDSKDVGLGGIPFYLDFNNNGQLDTFELKTNSDSGGFYQFTIPFGTYIVRIQSPKGYKATNNLNGRKVTLAKGQVASAGDFGLRKV